MAPRRSSFGLFGLFGRSADLRQLDQSLRQCGLEHRAIAEGVKLTMVNLMKNHAGEGEPEPQAYGPVAEMLAYCILGPAGFDAANGPDRRIVVEERIRQALDQDGSLDAQMILLAMHAGLIDGAVVDRFDLHAGE